MNNTIEQTVAKKHNLTIAGPADCNGYYRTIEHFDFETKDGYRSFSKNITLLLEKGTLKSINGVML